MSTRAFSAMMATCALALSACAFGVGHAVAALAADSLPNCYEDQALTRAAVPGPWQCVALDDLR